MLRGNKYKSKKGGGQKHPPGSPEGVGVCYSYSTGPGIYGSKLTQVRGRSPRTRAVYVTINPWQPCHNYYISHLIG